MRGRLVTIGGAAVALRAVGAIKGATENLAVDRYNALDHIGEFRHEPLKDGAEPSRIEQPEQPAEGIVTGYAVSQQAMN